MKVVCIITLTCNNAEKCYVDDILDLERNMDHGLRLIIYRSDAIFDNVTVMSQCVFKYNQISESDQEIKTSTGNKEDVCKKYIVSPVRLCAKGLISYLVSAYIVTLSNSYVYRKSALRVLFQWLHVRSFNEEYTQTIFIKLRTPKKQFLDYKWNEKLTQLFLERQEADHAMSWLSTLGGAFSALGEEFEHCAEVAGKISVRQFELAIRLGDPLLVARCRLYSALSLIQRDYFRTPQYMIRQIYKLALEQKDMRLQNMCHGMWAKLQYCHKQYKQRKKSEILHTSET